MLLLGLFVRLLFLTVSYFSLSRRKFVVWVQDILFFNKKIKSGRLYDYLVDFLFGLILLGVLQFGFTGHFNVFLPVIVPIFIIVIFF
jgi:hypothetical protein